MLRGAESRHTHINSAHGVCHPQTCLLNEQFRIFPAFFQISLAVRPQFCLRADQTTTHLPSAIATATPTACCVRKDTRAEEDGTVTSTPSRSRPLLQFVCTSHRRIRHFILVGTSPPFKAGRCPNTEHAETTCEQTAATQNPLLFFDIIVSFFLVFALSRS